MDVFPGSSMVEQEAVNFEVASSSLARGAIKSPLGFFRIKKADSDLRLRLRCESGPGSQLFKLKGAILAFFRACSSTPKA